MAHMKTHRTQQLCPRCDVNYLVHAHCAHARCTYVLVVCQQCDALQAVHHVMADHQKDCLPVMPTRYAA